MLISEPHFFLETLLSSASVPIPAGQSRLVDEAIQRPYARLELGEVNRCLLSIAGRAGLNPGLLLIHYAHVASMPLCRLFVNSRMTTNVHRVYPPSLTQLPRIQPNRVEKNSRTSSLKFGRRDPTLSHQLASPRVWKSCSLIRRPCSSSQHPPTTSNSSAYPRTTSPLSSRYNVPTFTSSSVASSLLWCLRTTPREEY